MGLPAARLVTLPFVGSLSLLRNRSNVGLINELRGLLGGVLCACSLSVSSIVLSSRNPPPSGLVLAIT